MNKLLNYVKGLSDSKSRMYKKSKDRLKELANTCNQVVSIISELIQDEALVNEGDDSSDEFGGSNVKDYLAALNSMEASISELRQFLSPKVSSSGTSVVSSNSEIKKHMLYDYRTCLKNLSESSQITEESEDCSRLVWSWFASRYLEGPESFRYNIQKISFWIRDIVVLYGYHLEQNSVGVFKSNFQKWIESISPENNYVVPYEVYKFEKKPDPKMLTLTAAVIWDIMLDSGLRDLCTKKYIDEDCIYSMIGTLNSEVMNPYTNYQYDTSILKRCGLTAKEGDEE